MPAADAQPRRLLRLERLEGRCLLTSYTLTPVVPTIDAAQQAFLTGILRAGAAVGNRQNVFARAGDSISIPPNFLTPLGAPTPGVDLTGDGSLSDTLAFFRSGTVGPDNSFTHPSVAAAGGFFAIQVLARLPAELALSRPSFVLIMVGTNDVGLRTPLEAYRSHLTGIVQTAINQGVVPVLSTIPDQLLAPVLQQWQPKYNQVIQDVAEATGVPVWNYWRAMQRLPNLGISPDGIHPSVAPFGGGDLGETGLDYGYNVRNLTAVQTLDKLRRVLLLGQPPDFPGGGEAWAPLTAGTLALAAGDTTGFQVETTDTTTRRVLFRFDPFPGFRGGVRTALGDVNGDDVPDLVAAVGPGGAPHVKAFDGRDGSLLASFLAYDAELAAGLNVAAGDVDGDGRDDIIVCPDVGAAAHVKVFAEGQLRASFFAFAAGFHGGGQVAAGDVDGDGRDEVIVAAGPGGSGHVMIFSGPDLALLTSYFAFDSFSGSVSLAAGDADGDGRAEVSIAVASAGLPHAKVFDAAGGVRASFYAYAPSYLAGVRLAMLDRDGDGREELFTASGLAAFADVRVFDALAQQPVDAFFAYALGFRRGLTLGG